MTILIKGQVSSGKNNMGVSRSGFHYPKKNFKNWRDSAVAQTVSQRAPHFTMFIEPLRLRVLYTPSDNRRRDVSAILDGLFHVLERSGIVRDDALIKDVEFHTNTVDKENPCVFMELGFKARG